MRRFFLLSSILLFATASLPATTWYVRLDGGTAKQCTGQTNAPYAGGTSAQWDTSTAYALNATVVDGNNHLEKVTTAGTSAVKYPPTWSTTGGTATDNTVVWRDQGVMASAQACAFDHPYWLATNNDTNFASFSWKIAGGDTVQFEDDGPYYMGLKLGSGPGVYWVGCIANDINCSLPPPPNGTSGNPTRFLGPGAGSCHNATHTALVNATTLSGINDVFTVLTVQGTNYIDEECLDITQPDVCSRMGAPWCTEGTNNYAWFGITFQNMNTTNQGPSNLTLKDISIHGMSSRGVIGSKINTLSTDVTTITDLYTVGNGGAGIDSDAGGCGKNCESIGTVNFSWPMAAWNGCLQVSPGVYTACYDDGASPAGYGDGFVFIASKANMTIDHGRFLYNTQDGLDAYHFNDDLASSPVLTVYDSVSIGNEGAVYKVGGATVTAYNNVGNTNCLVLATASNFPANPTGWNAGIKDPCRAAGDGWSIQLNNGNTVKLFNNTTTGYSATMYDLGCASGGTCTTGTIVDFENNISKSYSHPGYNGGVPSGGLYTAGLGSNPFANAGSVISNNLWSGMKSSLCPQEPSYETAQQCGDPLLQSESNWDSVNANLTTGSPAIGHGVTISGITTDFNSKTRPTPPAIGAYELVPPAVPVGSGTVNGRIASTPGSAIVGVAATFTANCLYSDGSTMPCTVHGSFSIH